MKFLKNYWFVALALVFFTMSCQKENILQTGIESETPETREITVNPLLGRSVSSEDGLEMDCFEISYPFSILDEEGVSYSVNSDEEWEALLTNEEYIFVDFVYPLNITFEDDETAEIADNEALAEAFVSCIPDGGWEEGQFPAYLISLDNSCYEFVYPITVVNVEGEETVVNNEEEFNGAVATEIQFFVFPITLLDEEGEEVVVNDIDETFETLISCGGWDDEDGGDWETGFEYIGCYTVNFPLDVVLTDGTVVTVNDHMEFCDLMLQGQLAGYAFPMTLTDLEGNEFTVASQEELDAALEDCPEFNGGGDESLILLFELLSASETYADCFTLNYPIVILSGEILTTVNSMEEIELVFTSNTPPTGMELPASVTMVADGSVVELNSLEEYFVLTEGCN